MLVFWGITRDTLYIEWYFTLMPEYLNLIIPKYV